MTPKPDEASTPRAFEYLLNAMEIASQHDDPFSQNYGEKRMAVLAHVGELQHELARAKQERDALLNVSSFASQTDRAQIEAAAYRRAAEVCLNGRWSLLPNPLEIQQQFATAILALIKE